MPNVICVKWGTLYGPDYVNILRAMVKRNLSIGHRFVCFTDDPTGLDPDIETAPIPPIDLPEKRTPGWRKISLFHPQLHDLQGPTLFLDLDIVITGNIDCFFEHEKDKFCIIRNWTSSGQRIGNSSVYRFEAGAYPYVYDYLVQNAAAMIAEHTISQVYLSRTMDRLGNLHFWPDDWTCSFKRHCVPKGVMRFFKRPEMPTGTRIVVFHGDPKPPDAVVGRWPGGLHKHIRPTPWVAEHWRA